MLEDSKGSKDSLTVCVIGEKRLDYREERKEELESVEASTDSRRMRSGMTRWGRCLGG